jgi:RNA polymerase sigma factor (sigma-70 family)
MSPRISIRLLSAQSDQRLAGLAGEGHERAFEALVHRYRRQLLRYCRGMRLSDARAEDVLQQAFLQAWMAFARGTEVREVRPWLYRIVHNAAINAMRGAADDHSELTEAMQAKAALAGESELQRKMAVHEALADMAALPQMQQQAIFLTAVDGQSHDEVASVLGISEGALRGLLYRARASLRSAAAALTPPPLLEWAARGADTAGPTAERIAELSSGGAAAGVTGLLLKGAVVAVTAGAVATGASVVHGPGGRPAAHRTSSAAPAASTAGRQPAARTVALVSPSSLRISQGEHAGRVHQNGRAGRREGTGDGSAAGHRDRSSSAEDNRGKSLRSDAGGKEGPEHGAGGSGRSDPSDSKGGGSGSADGGGGSASSGSATSGRDREASTTDGGAQPAVTSGASSGGGSGSSSGTGEGTAATASLVTGDASGPDDPAQAGVAGTRDG